MDKKILAGTLVLALCLGMVIPAIPAREGSPVIKVAYKYSKPFHQKNLEMDIDMAREVLEERGVEVNIKAIGMNVATDEDWKARLALDFMSGTAADVVFIDGFWVASLASAGYLLPLPVEEWPEWDKFYPSMQWYSTYKGEVYSTVVDTDVRMLFYNKATFKKAGLPEEWEPKTWDDVLSTLRTIKQELPGVTPFASDITAIQGEATTMQNFEMTYLGSLPEDRVKQGTWLYDPALDKWIVNEEGLTDTLQFLRTIYIDEKLGDPIAALEAGILDWKRRCEDLKDGKLAVALDGCWNYEDTWGLDAAVPWPEREEELGWAPMPGSGREGTPMFTCIGGGWAWAINSDTKHPDLAFGVVKALASPKVLSFHNSFTAHIPPRSDVRLSKEFTRYPAVIDFLENATEKLMPYSTFRPGMPDYPKVSELIYKMVESVCIGDKTPQQAYERYLSKLTKLVGSGNVLVE